MQRVFLGWDSPCLGSAAEYLHARYAVPGLLNLSGAVVVLPGARAGDRLLEILVQLCESRKTRLIPPRIVTTGGLSDILFQSERRIADSLTRNLLWSDVLQKIRKSELKQVIPAPPDPGDVIGWMTLAEIFSKLDAELCGDLLTFADVAERGRAAGFGDYDRWRYMAQWQEAYLNRLRASDLGDPNHEKLAAIKKNRCTTDLDIILVGVVDLPGSTRRMLEHVGGRVAPLVHAPRELHEAFDLLGTIKIDVWRKRRINVPGNLIQVVEGPSDQSDAVLHAIADLRGQFSAEQITVGVPDQQVVPYIQQALQRCALPGRYAAGVSISRTGPFRLLAQISDYLERRQFEQFAALARHPDFEAWLRLDHGDIENPIGGADLLIALDEYHSRHIPVSVSEWVDDKELSEVLTRVHGAVEKLLKNLSATPQKLNQWAEPVIGFIAEVYGWRQLDQNRYEDRVIIETCDVLRDILRTFNALDSELAPRVSASDAIRLVLRQIERESIPAPADNAAIELLGWLELVLDDAPALIITGMNEGLVPESIQSDPFLSDKLRKSFGLVSNDRRHARDAYALSAILASRPHLKLISGRLSAAGDPLAPSRLLLSCNDEQLPARVKTYFGKPGKTGVELPGKLVAGRQDSEFIVPPPEKTGNPLTSIRVTAFKDYISCPYRFYLRHVLELGSLDDSAQELSAPAFGSLVHDALREFGKARLSRPADPRQIYEFLRDQLASRIKQIYGNQPFAAIAIQQEQLNARLEAFANWQAGWTRQGYRIERTEDERGADRFNLDVDGAPMTVRGRIDRIDINEQTLERVIFDYKTSDGDPESAHRRKGQWVDLQLPMYRHLAAALGITGKVKLGYIQLPKDLHNVGGKVAQWTDAELDQADEIAREVVRRIRREEFLPVNKDITFADEFKRILGCDD